MSSRIRCLIWAPLISTIVLAGCIGHGNLKPRGKLIDSASLASTRTLAQSTTDADAWPKQQWWKVLGDAQLDALVAEADEKSPSLAAAQARIEQARALAETRGAVLAPDVSGNFKAARQRLSENGFFPPPFGGSKFTQYDLTVDLKYALDFWGQNSALLKSALNAERAAEVDRYAARLLLIADIVKSYVQLDRAYVLRDIAQATLDQRKQLLDLTQKRVTAGLDTQLDLKQSDAALPQSQGDIVRLNQQIKVLQHQLAALTGQGPDRGLSLDRPHLHAAQAAALPTVVPANLVGRRPDVVAQRWRVEASAEDIHAAHAAFYPDINLAASLGFESLGLDHLLDFGSHTYNVGPALRLPIFGGGRLRAQLRANDASFDLAVADYNRTVIGALQEVADILSALASIEEERDAADRAVTALQGAYDIAVLRYRAGLSNYLVVLIAEGQVLQQKQLRADIEARKLDASVSLIRALGGGFEPAADESAS